MVDKPQPTIEEAVNRHLAHLGPAEAISSQTELQRFVRWFGKDRALGSITASAVGRYAESFSTADTDSTRKAEAVRKFLSFAKKEGWTTANLALSIKVRKEKSHATGVTRTVRADLTVLTPQGYAEIQLELASLRGQRPSVLDDIRRAAADKDFRENAPLHAAREQLGHIDGRIQELAAIIKSANIIGPSGQEHSRVAVGSTVHLKDSKSGEERCFTIVGPKEASPAAGKISHVSPIGKAVLGKARGDKVEVQVPSGKHCYMVEQID
jgi:transcription elongation factor GreA